jgi:hypothetical protein
MAEPQKQAGVKVPVRKPDRFQPLFVLTTARSYSSVVTTMIGQHPGLMALPELKLFAYGTIGELAASLPRYWIQRGVKHRSPGLVRAVAQLEFGNQSAGSLATALKWLEDRAHCSGAGIFDLLLERISPRTGVEKSPENVETDEALRRLAAAYPRARYLHLTRHPITTQQSMQEHLQRTVPGLSRQDQPMLGIACWAETHGRILCFAATRPQQAYLRVKAEEILNDTDAQLRSIAAWLGIRADAAAVEAMRHPENSLFASPGSAESGIMGGNDPGFLRDPIPHTVEVPRLLARPPGWVGNASLWQRTVDLANRLGYP